MTDPQTSEWAATTTCHVAILYGIESEDRVGSRCETLPAEVCQEVANAAAGWRDRIYAVRRVAALMRSRNLPGIAIVYDDCPDRKVNLPRPFEVPFEPIPLDEAHPVLGHLVDMTPPMKCGAQSKPSRNNPIRRFFRRYGLPRSISIMIVFQLAAYFTGGILSPRSAGLIICAAFGAVGLTMVIRWFVARELLIVPGGVFIRRYRIGTHRSALARFTPADTVLFVINTPLGCHIELWALPARKPVNRRVTELELTGLLAAWQSPITAPPVERMRDFQFDE